MAGSLAAPLGGCLTGDRLAPSAHAERAWRAFMEGRRQDGRRELEAAERAGPVPETLAIRARFLVFRGELDRAEGLLRQVKARAPHLIAARNELGVLLMLGGRTPEALQEFEALARISNAPPEILNNLGVALLARRRIAAAERVLRRAVAGNIRNATATSNHALALYELGRKSEAHRAWRAAVYMDPSNAGALAGLGICLLQKGRDREGIRALAQAAMLDASFRTGREAAARCAWPPTAAADLDAGLRRVPVIARIRQQSPLQLIGRGPLLSVPDPLLRAAPDPPGARSAGA